MANIRLVSGNWYRIKDHTGAEHIAQYYGREEGFECCVCGYGRQCYAFNFWHNKDGDYETLAFGKEHLPTILEKVGGMDDIIIDQ